MSESIFRQSALDRLANPERLDAPLILVRRTSWLLLITLVVAMAAALLWSVVARAPVKVSSQGVLIGQGGLAEIVTDEAGRIEKLLVTSGQRVRAGDPIATVRRTDLERELADAQAKLEAAQDRFARLSGFYAQRGAQDGGANAIRLGTLAESRHALEERAARLQDKLARMQALVGSGFVPQDRVLETQASLAEARERISNLGEAAVRVRIDANAKAGEAGLSLLDEQRTIEEQQRLIARLSAQLAEQRVVRASEAGQITEIKVAGGDVVGPGSAIATLAPTESDGAMVALLYVPVAEGKRIQPGMAAEIVPATVERAVYGHIPGRVLTVAPLPATTEGMRRVLRNDTLVQQLMAGGAPIEVRVALERDRGLPSGYRWSASKGPRRAISAGTMLTGEVVIDRKRMIALLVPQTAD